MKIVVPVAINKRFYRLQGILVFRSHSAFRNSNGNTFSGDVKYRWATKNLQFSITDI